VTELIRARAQAVGRARILPIAALTRGCKGERLTEMFDLREGGAVALGDGSRAVADAGLLRRAMEYARAVGLPVFEHPEDAALAGKGVMHEGPVATRLGLAGVPAAAEDVVVMRDIAVAEHTGARLHLGPISTRGAVRAVRMAKDAGLPVTCAVTAAHLHLTDEALAEAYDPNLRVRPPLRSADHVEALRAAVADGTIDAVASGHRPQSPVEKDVELDLAGPGMIGLETALGLVLRLVHAGALSLPAAIARLATGPARALGLEFGRLSVGAPADVVVFDPDARVRVEAAGLASRARNTPFLGQVLPGKVDVTLVGGRIVYSAEAAMEASR
jgi:dihydroorotase